MPRLDDVRISRIPAWANSMNGVSSMRTPRAGEPVEHLVGQQLELGQPLHGPGQLPAIVARVGGEARQADLDAVDALLDLAGRLGDAVGLAVDQSDDVGDLADGLGDRREADWATRLRSTPISISEVTASASRVSEAIVPVISLVAVRVSWASFFTSAATTANERPASPARAASIVALRASMLVRLAIARCSTRRSGPGSSPRRSRSSARPAGRRGRSGREKMGSCPRSRRGLRTELLARLLGEDPRLVGRIRPPAPGRAAAGWSPPRANRASRRLDEIRSVTPAT